MVTSPHGQALIDYIRSDFDISVYWDTLNKNGITKERLLSYDRPIHSEPNFRSEQKEGLLRDLGNYMRSLKVCKTAVVDQKHRETYAVCLYEEWLLQRSSHTKFSLNLEKHLLLCSLEIISDLP